MVNATIMFAVNITPLNDKSEEETPTNLIPIFFPSTYMNLANSL